MKRRSNINETIKLTIVIATVLILNVNINNYCIDVAAFSIAPINRTPTILNQKERQQKLLRNPYYSSNTRIHPNKRIEILAQTDRYNVAILKQYANGEGENFEQYLDNCRHVESSSIVTKLSQRIISLLHRFTMQSSYRIRILHKKIRKVIVAAIFVATVLTNTIAMAAGTSGGRMGGGSFKSYSSSPSMSRPSLGGGSSSSGSSNRSSGTRRVMLPPPSRRMYSNLYPSNRPQIVLDYRSPHVIMNHFSGPGMYNSRQSSVSALKNVLLLTGAGMLIAHGVANDVYRRKDEGNDGDMNGASRGR
jgi:hypothetical protein